MSRKDALNTKFWTEFAISYGEGIFLIVIFILFLFKDHFLNMSASEYIVHVGRMIY